MIYIDTVKLDQIVELIIVLDSRNRAAKFALDACVYVCMASSI